MASEPKSFFLSAELHRYLLEHGTPPDAIQRELIEETAGLGGIAMMQIAPEQGAFMTMLTQLTGTRRAIEIGTFTGYSALAIARGLPADGRLLCCDVSEEWTTIARKYWEKAGVADRVELRLGPALDTLAALPDEPTFDLAFIDADKGNYPGYYEGVLARMVPNGVILIDNVLRGGAVIDQHANDDDTNAMRAFNKLVAGDDRVDTVMLPIADGLTFARKR
ncbi:MAG TPA: O-methyltransferase [Acidimicrobiia bacterium]